MKLNFSDFLRKGQFPLLIALGLFPGLALVIIASLPAAWPMQWVFPAAYVLLAWVCLTLPGKIRLAGGLAGSCALMALGVYLMPEKSLFGGISLLSPLLYSAALLGGLRFSSWPRDREIPFAVLATGVVLHVLWQILVNLGTAYDFAAAPMLWCFLAFLVLAVLSMNRGSVNASAMGRQKVSTVMRRQNFFLSLGLLVLVIALAALPAVISAIENAWSTLMNLLARLGAWLSSLLPEMTEEQAGGSMGGSMSMMGMEASEPSAFALLMEKVAMALGAVLAAAALFFGGRFLYRKLKVLLRYLLKRLGEYAAHSTEDYEDEITDTREGGEKEGTGFTRLFSMMERVDERKLTPTQRIRYRYSRLQRRHKDWLPGATAREKLSPEAAEIYERARYSSHPVHEQDAEAFAAQTRRLP